MQRKTMASGNVLLKRRRRFDGTRMRGRLGNRRAAITTPVAAKAARSLTPHRGRPLAHPRKMKDAPSAMSAKPIAWFQVRFSPSQKIEKPAKTISVITSCIVFSCAVE